MIECSEELGVLGIEKGSGRSPFCIVATAASSRKKLQAYQLTTRHIKLAVVRALHILLANVYFEFNRHKKS